MTIACLQDNSIAELLDGAADQARLAELEAHLDGCVACRQLLAGVAASSRTQAGAPRLGAEPSQELAPGSLLGGYSIERTIGEGAMGVVYLAHDAQLQRRAAVKLIRFRVHPRRDALRARFVREAQAMARITHANVVGIYGVGVSPEGDLFIAMQLIEGGTVRQWLQERARGWREMLAVYLEAGEGLAATHARGLVHRDFKPDNVMVDQSGRALVTDFGLARATEAVLHEAGASEAEAARAQLSSILVTGPGAIIGSPAYMAPEQMLSAFADARSDLFAFCVSLYEALYGERPFAGTTLEEVQASIRAQAVRPSLQRGVPSGLRAALLPGLRAAPEQRPESISALLQELRRAAEGEPEASRLSSLFTRGARWLRGSVRPGRR